MDSRRRFGEWLERQFVLWQADQGAIRTQKQFADYLGISQSALNNYMNGLQQPTGANLVKIAARLGSEVYEVLGLPPPDTQLEFINSIWHQIPPEKRRELLELAEKYYAESTQSIPAKAQRSATQAP